MKSCRWLWWGLLLLGGTVHAEGGCPPGLIPANGTNINSCVPIPPGYYNNQRLARPQPPPPRWATRWGAIATDGPKGSLGTASGLSNKSDAERVSLADCRAKGGTQCKVDIAYDNECAAVIVGDGGYNTPTAATVDKAVEIGINTCSTATTNCHVYYSACSLPIRIQ